MKKKAALTLILSLILFSCVGPETTVTNTVNSDGSILRRVEMSNTENKFLKQQLRVPVDSTWAFNDSISVSEKGDTTWYRTAGKRFINADAINQAYLSDSGANRGVARTAFFERRFRWFTTTYYFSETCGKSLLHALPAEKFLSPEEIGFMNMPRKVKIELLNGADSSEYRTLSDTLDEKSEIWFARSVISEWIEIAGALCEASGKDSLTTEMLRSHEDDFFKQLGENAEFGAGCDSVLGAGIYEAFQTELDSARKVTEEKFDLSFSFSEYTMQVVMPSEIISTNGYRDADGRVSWPVSGELFLNTDYIMYAQSRTINYWAIIITLLLAVVLPFDISNHIRKWKKRKR
ncbi:MAG TPA: hypothetical protein VLQ76_06200 [Bacteroidales bacterium]|nr:hypothetical protein [Bacteroidales bacterium]